MRENYEAVSFIPEPSVRERYLRLNRYVLQLDERGNAVGYLLHGAILMGRPCVISQHVIQYEKRLRGYGEIAFRVLLERCQRGGSSSIHLRCAEDLPSVIFWQSVGFRVRGVVDQHNTRKRLIIEMNYPLDLPMGF